MKLGVIASLISTLSLLVFGNCNMPALTHFWGGNRLVPFRVSFWNSF